MFMSAPSRARIDVGDLATEALFALTPGALPCVPASQPCLLAVDEQADEDDDLDEDDDEDWEDEDEGEEDDEAEDEVGWDDDDEDDDDDEKEEEPS